MKIRCIDEDGFPLTYEVSSKWFPEPWTFTYQGPDNPEEWTNDDFVWFLKGQLDEARSNVRRGESEFNDLRDNHVKRAFKLQEAFEKIREYEKKEEQNKNTSNS